MRIRITIITIYHSQFNNQFECTNQIIKVALQYALKDISNTDFINFLSAFKQMFNNNINAFTKQISNEMTDSDAKKFETEHKIHQ